MHNMGERSKILSTQSKVWNTDSAVNDLNPKPVPARILIEMAALYRLFVEI